MDEIQMEKYFIMSLAHLLFPTLHEKKLLVSPGTKNQNNDEVKKNPVNPAVMTWETLIKNASEPLNYRLTAYCRAVRNFSHLTTSISM